MPPKASPKAVEEKVDAKKCWEVVGGIDSDGIEVRASQDLQSQAFEEYLGIGALVKEVKLINDQMYYEKLVGIGPQAGWVSIKGVVNQSSQEMLKRAHPETLGKPILVCWYSGGFSVKEGRELIRPFLEAAALAGIEDQLVLDHPEDYIQGSGTEPWSSYIDRLVYEINEKKAFRNRPLLLFGHSRGACSAVSMATRLGRRVRKVYIVACGGGALQIGQPSSWEKMSDKFKKTGDKGIFQFYASLQPNNLVLGRAAAASEAELEELVQSSAWLQDRVELGRRQFRDAIVPDMSQQFDVDVIKAPMLAIRPSEDESCPQEAMGLWKGITSNCFEVLTLRAGHMDCLQPEHMSVVIEDMLTFFP